jgi:GNAT superfamily N-acetyltransferase
MNSSILHRDIPSQMIREWQRADAMTATAGLSDLRSRFRGDVLSPNDPAYDQARRVWNAMIDRRPALIARCAGAADVICALLFARDSGMAVSVKGGGHNVAGSAVCDAGVMIDLSPMRGVRVDAGARAVTAQGGCTWRDLDHEAHALGLATTVGFSWICDHFWFLAQLFVEPNIQHKGLGRALLGKALEQSEACNATNRALITFAYSPFSTGLYAQHGVFPQIPLYRMSGPSHVINSRLGSSDCTCLAIELAAPSIKVLGQIDQDVLGFRRDKHHSFSMQSHAARALLIRRAGRDIGYAYIASDGHIGPIALVDASAGAKAVTAVLKRAVDMGTEQVSMIVPGPAAGCMAAAVAAGMRIGEPLVLLSSRPFGDWRRYLPRDPGYM